MVANLRNQNLSELILLLGLCCIFAGGTFALLNQVNASYDELTQQQLMKFDRVRSIAAFKSEVAQPMQGAAPPPGADFFFADGTSAVVTAQLLSNLKNIASAHGLDVLRAADLPTRQDGPIELVGGSADLSGNMTNVFAFIQDIESAKPVLFIEKLELHSNLGGTAGADAETFLTVSIQVSGVAHTPIEVNSAGNN